MKVISNFKIDKNIDLKNLEIEEGHALTEIEEKDLEFISGGGEWDCSNWTCSYRW